MPDDLLHDLTSTVAAQLLGVHEDTLKRWAADGKIDALKTPGGRWRFRRSDLETFIADGRDRSAPDPTEQAS